MATKNDFESIINKLKGLGAEFEVIEHPPVVTIEDVVCVLNVPVEAMAKTILFDVDQTGLVAVILPGLCRVDYSKLATALGVGRMTIKLFTESRAKELGILFGAISPLGGPYHRVLLDLKLSNQEMVYCGSGDLSKTIKISPATIASSVLVIEADVSK